MRKLISLLIVVLLGITTFAQERTVNLNTELAPRGQAWNLKRDGVRLVYTGGTSDVLLPTTRDTIDFTLQVGSKGRLNQPLHFYVNINSKGVGGTDTTFVIASDYKISTRDTYAQLVADKTSAVNPVAGINTFITSYGVLADVTTTQTVAAYNAPFDARVATVTAYDVPFTNIAAGTADTLEFPTQTVTFAADTLEVPAQTYTISSVQNAGLHYRFIRIRLILDGNDSVGTGVEIDEVEIIFDL